MPSSITFFGLGLATLYLGYRITIRLRLSRAKHPSLRGHAKWSRRIASCVPMFEYQADEFLRVDGAPEDISKQRELSLSALTKRIERQTPETIKASFSLEGSLPDIEFTTAYKIPFPFRSHVPKALRTAWLAHRTEGCTIEDPDGNSRYDLSGSYGVNIFGYDFYKKCIQKGTKATKALGPVLGPYHPLIAENVSKIKAISGLDAVSFHMSGTEAVMQAVRLARYHTKKRYLVRFCGAYHGWWDGVQPGVGNRRQGNDVYTLSDLSEATIKVLKTRNDIACLLINPLQALHPNSDTASDVTLITGTRTAQFDKAAYATWLQRLRQICNEKGIVLIFDEVFTGFRLGYKGAQDYFQVQADLVTYGKSLGGGFPVGVLAGKQALMKRYRDHRPADVCYARGTFNSHPYIMGSMNAFLKAIEQPEIQTLYAEAENVWNRRTQQLNQAFEEEKLPLKVANMHSVISLLYTQPGRYHWMLQFYLHEAGLQLAWIGTGRFIMSLDYTDDDFNEVIQRFLIAARQMRRDGWWWIPKGTTHKSLKQQFVKQFIRGALTKTRQQS